MGAPFEINELLNNPPILVAVILALTVAIGVILAKYSMLKQRMILENENHHHQQVQVDQSETKADPESQGESEIEDRLSGKEGNSSAEEDEEEMPDLTDNHEDVVMTQGAKQKMAADFQAEIAKMGGCPFSGMGASGEDPTSDPSPAGADPFEFVDHIQSEVKKVNHRAQEKALKKELPDFDPAKEREAAAAQMEVIFKLLKDQEDQFGVKSMDDMQSQLKLYMDK